MDKRIKAKAQELYPISDNAECYTAFIQGANTAQQELIEKACGILEDMTEGRLGKRFIS